MILEPILYGTLAFNARFDRLTYPLTIRGEIAIFQCQKSGRKW